MKHLDSPCGRYRYLVTTKVAEQGAPLGFILGHPSEGPPEQDVAIHRCMFIAKRGGYGGAIIVYANALKQLYIAEAKKPSEVIGEKADECLARMAKMCKASVRAYGTAIDTLRGARVSLQLATNPEHVSLCLPFTPSKFPGSIMSVGKGVELWPFPPVFLYHAESDAAMVVSREAWDSGQYSEGTGACEPISFERYQELKEEERRAQNT